MAAAESSSVYLRRRRRVRLGIAGLAVVLGLLAVADHFKLFARWGGNKGDDQALYDGRSIPVIRIIDGRTLEIPGQRVRLIGIESADPASLAAVVGKTVTLRLEPLRTRDTDGALLAYVYPSDDVQLNLEMLKAGRAKMDHSAHHAFEAQFAQAESTAKRRRAGVWQSP